jgi:hypothetical protein
VVTTGAVTTALCAAAHGAGHAQSAPSSSAARISQNIG